MGYLHPSPGVRLEEGALGGKMIMVKSAGEINRESLAVLPSGRSRGVKEGVSLALRTFQISKY